MNLRHVVTTLILICSAIPQFLLASPTDNQLPTLKAIVSADNDITPGSTPESGQAPIPASVREEIDQIISADFKTIKKYACETEDCSIKIRDMYGPVFRIKTPTGLDVYVFEEIGPTGGSNYYFTLYDAKTGRLTKEPAYIYGKWLDMFFGDKDSSLLKRPFISFTKINGKESMIVEDYGHNGTMYNAAIYRYFRINNNLSLTPILAVERRAIWPSDKPYLQTVARKLKFTGDKSAEIFTYLYSENRTPPLYLGKVSIKMTDKGQFKINKKYYKDKKYEYVLVTLSETNEQQFIVGGDRLFY